MRKRNCFAVLLVVDLTTAALAQSIEKIGMIDSTSSQSVNEKKNQPKNGNSNTPVSDLTISSSPTTKRQLPSIAIGGGGLTFLGDISGSLFSNYAPAYNITCEQALNKFFSVSVNGLYGQMHGSKVINTQFLNFQTSLFQGDANVSFHLNKPISPYFSVGVGYLQFNPYGDLKDANGNTYNYWSDGTLRNLPQNSPNSNSATVLTRDYKYETKLTDSTTHYNRNTAIIPIGLGIDIKLWKHASLRAGATYYFTFSDWIDNYKAGNSTDSYLYTNVSFYYHISAYKHKDESSPEIIKIDTRDSDGDGVKDISDKCANTPSGLKVNEYGCPLDTDKDGIADYKDKESNSRPNAVVNEDGVTFTTEMIAKRREEFNAFASGKLQKFLEVAMTPIDTVDTAELIALRNKEQETRNTLKYGSVLKEVGETETSKSKSKKTIPADLISFDKNQDNYISKKEITMTINKFFEGDPTITLQKIVQLIDYFFEQ
jgi:hypothetical protein